MSSCDRKEKVAIIKNETFAAITMVIWDDKEFGPITDSMIYNDRVYMPDRIESKSFETFTLPNREFSAASDSSNLNLYFFNLDSLWYYQKANLKKGILNRCLFKKLTIQTNRIKEPLDTIYIRTL